MLDNMSCTDSITSPEDAPFTWSHEWGDLRKTEAMSGCVVEGQEMQRGRYQRTIQCGVVWTTTLVTV